MKNNSFRAMLHLLYWQYVFLNCLAEKNIIAVMENYA